MKKIEPSLLKVKLDCVLVQFLKTELLKE